MIIVIASLLAVVAIAFILGVRPKDLPEPEPESPFAYLDERKAAIYENLRDLQFEYRVGKLSDEDYQNTKKDLQKELASVLAEVDRLRAQLSGAGPAAAVSSKPAPALSGTGSAAIVNSKSAPPSPGSGPAAAASSIPAPQPAVNTLICPSCGATFEKQLKFCGECGKPMKVARA